MIEELQQIQKRFEEYESEYAQVLRHFHDTDSLNYFTDRFGYDHPLSDNAERGVRIERRFRKMKNEIKDFAKLFNDKFPKIKD